MTKKRKNCLKTVGLKRFESYKSSTSPVWEIILHQTLPPKAAKLFQLPTYPTTGEKSPKPPYDQNSVLNICQKLTLFHNWINWCTATNKRKTFFIIRQCLQFILFCARNLIFYQILVLISRRRFSSLTLCTSLIGRISWPMCLCGTWLWYYFPPWSSYKIEQYNREKRKTFRLCRKSKCIRNKDHHNCSIHEEHTSSIFMNPYNLWDKNPAALMTLKSALSFILIHDAVKSN